MAIYPPGAQETNQVEFLENTPKEEHRTGHWSAGFLHRLSRNFRLALVLTTASTVTISRSATAQESSSEGIYRYRAELPFVVGEDIDTQCANLIAKAVGIESFNSFDMFIERSTLRRIEAKEYQIKSLKLLLGVIYAIDADGRPIDRIDFSPSAIEKAIAIRDRTLPTECSFRSKEICNHRAELPFDPNKSWGSQLAELIAKALVIDPSEDLIFSISHMFLFAPQDLEILETAASNNKIRSIKLVFGRIYFLDVDGKVIGSGSDATSAIERATTFRVPSKTNKKAENTMKESAEIDVGRLFGQRSPEKVNFEQINQAIDRNDYQTAARLMDKILEEYSFDNPDIYLIAIDVYNRANQGTKNPRICEEGVKKSDIKTNKAKFIELLDECARGLLETKYSEKGIQFLLTKYSLQTGSIDKQTILAKIALNENDAFRVVKAFQYAEKHQEAADLLTFFFQTNPSIMQKPQPNRFFNLAEGLHLAFNAHSAYYYWLQRKTDERSAQRWERILRVVIPAVAIGIGVKHLMDQDAREAKRKAEEERKRAEAAEWQRQAERAQENARRRAQGLPSLEEEEERRRESNAREREIRINRCRRDCEREYHSCMGNTNVNCCNVAFCGEFGVCPTSCERWLGSCQHNCE